MTTLTISQIELWQTRTAAWNVEELRVGPWTVSSQWRHSDAERPFSRSESARYIATVLEVLLIWNAVDFWLVLPHTDKYSSTIHMIKWNLLSYKEKWQLESIRAMSSGFLVLLQKHRSKSVKQRLCWCLVNCCQHSFSRLKLTSCRLQYVCSVIFVLIYFFVLVFVHENTTVRVTCFHWLLVLLSTLTKLTHIRLLTMQSAFLIRTFGHSHSIHWLQPEQTRTHQQMR